MNPNYKDHSPTTHCTPDLIMSPLRQSKRRNIFLRAQTEEIKKVWQNLITQQVFNINSPGSINHVESNKVNLLVKNPSTQTDIFSNVSTKKNETENICSPYRRNYNNAHSNGNQLNLKSQHAFDMGDSLEKFSAVDDVEEDHLITPETPSCANVSSLNDKIQKSLSSITFSSVKNMNSDCGESCEGIFNDFGSGDLSFSNDVKECMFLQNDPFFADE
jgi:regulatory protein YycH of two-component signal transduction system YycFG